MALRRRGARRRLPGAAAPDGTPLPGEVYLEYRFVGDLLRVAAIDAETGTEVSVFGPSSVSRDELGRIAARKLARRLAAIRDV